MLGHGQHYPKAIWEILKYLEGPMTFLAVVAFLICSLALTRRAEKCSQAVVSVLVKGVTSSTIFEVRNLLWSPFGYSAVIMKRCSKRSRLSLEMVPCILDLGEGDIGSTYDSGY